MEKAKLFGLPYAGGSSVMFKNWKSKLDPSIELVPVELAGRGRRIEEPFYADINEAVADVYRQIRHELGEPGTEPEYALFGHSMGCLIAFELYYKIVEMNHRTPKTLFLSGRPAPHLDPIAKKVHMLPDREFIEEIVKLGGTPAALFENEELADIFLPLLRADYKLAETYDYVPRPNKIDCDISVFYGKYDELFSSDAIGEWEPHTSGACHLYGFEGGHFFVADCEDDLLSVINQTLMNR